MSKPVKIIIETTEKGKQPTIHASGATFHAIKICFENYIDFKGACIIKGLAIPCQMEFIFDYQIHEITSRKVLSYETII